MLAFTLVGLLISGILLIFSMSAVFLLLWNNVRREVYPYYIIVLLMALIWIFSSIILRITPLLFDELFLSNEALIAIEIGYGGTIITCYLLTTKITDIHRPSTRWAIWLAIVMSIVYRVSYEFVLGIEPVFSFNDNNILSYDFPQLNFIIYSIFAIAMFYVAWRNAEKVDTELLRNNIMLFASAFMLSILSPQLRSYAIPEMICAIAVFGMGYSFVQHDVMLPFLGRNRQMEVMRDVGIAITSKVHSNEVLNVITNQSADLLEADGSAIYLTGTEHLVLAAVHNIPDEFIGYTMSIDQGLAGKAASTKKMQLIHHYYREWKGHPDMPVAKESFGSTLAVPLMFRNTVVGVLLIIRGRKGSLFSAYDQQLLSLLAPQAAVTITNSHLFRQERSLKEETNVAKQQLEVVLASTENPVVAIDNNMQIIFANPAAGHLLAYPPKALVGQRLNELIDAELLPERRNLFVDLKHNNSHVYEVNMNDHDYLVHVARLQDPSDGWVAVLNDITKLKQIDRLKSQMVRMTSHDLKNPLFSTMTYMELLEEDGEDVFNDEMRHYISSMWQQLERMQRIISGILDLEKIQSGAPPMAPCELNPLLNSIVSDVTNQAKTKNITFEPEINDSLPQVLGDARQLEQVIMNLLDNAIKYSKTAGTVVLRAYHRDDTVIIEVEDDGIGIPQNVQNQVFDRFFRVNSTQTQGISGSGIGLSLVKAIVDYHKGRVWLKSEENEGTVFFVALPVAKISAAA